MTTWKEAIEAIRQDRVIAMARKARRDQLMRMLYEEVFHEVYESLLKKAA